MGARARMSDLATKQALSHLSHLSHLAKIRWDNADSLEFPGLSHLSHLGGSRAYTRACSARSRTTCPALPSRAACPSDVSTSLSSKLDGTDRTDRTTAENKGFPVVPSVFATRRSDGTGGTSGDSRRNRAIARSVASQAVAAERVNDRGFARIAVATTGSASVSPPRPTAPHPAPCQIFDTPCHAPAFACHASGGS